jgi:hypothetical protein
MKPREVLLKFTFALIYVVPAYATSETAAEQEKPAPTVSGRLGRARPDDSVWLVSTRHLGYPPRQEPDQPNIRVLRRTGSGRWRPSDVDCLLGDDDPRAITVVFVDGNWVSGSDGFVRGWQAYCRLVHGVPSETPIRFVIWSWPSTRIRGLLRDARVKAARADRESVYLARFLARLPQDRRLGLFGFSYGSRVITGALHLRGGGTLLGYRLPRDTTPPSRSARVVLWAAAEHNYWLLPRGAHGACLAPVDRLLLQYNSRDFVLRQYHRVDRHCRAEALGRTGFPWSASLGENAARLDQRDTSCWIGRKHELRAYLASAPIMADVRRYVLWQDL